MKHPLKYPKLVAALAQIHDEVQRLVAATDGDDYRKQYHPDLSPLGWHYGHIVYTENLWLRDTLLKQCSLTASDHQLYNPQHLPKQQRGAALLPRDSLLEQGRAQLNDNLSLFNNPPPPLAQHPLMADAYLLKFLLQHHAMHLETMKMVMTQRHIQRHAQQPLPNDCSGGLKQAIPQRRQAVLFEGQQYRIGGTDNWSFDNELPRHSLPLRAFAIERHPVSNAEYLGFVEAGGYHDERYWSSEGLAWLKATNAVAADGWRYQDGWFQATPEGYKGLAAKAAVCGLCYHEAQAYARYAEARLPHEYEREVAAARLAQSTDTWEWCSNRFHPYPHYRPCPYPEYSQAWFDGQHYVLRGGCRFNDTTAHLRASFRNFHTKCKRHIFAGVRLAYDVNPQRAF